MSPTIPKLVVLSGERQGTSLEVTRMLSIGSNRSSDLHLRDAAVSWNHARVLCAASSARYSAQAVLRWAKVPPCVGGVVTLPGDAPRSDGSRLNASFLDVKFRAT